LVTVYVMSMAPPHRSAANTFCTLTWGPTLVATPLVIVMVAAASSKVTV
jgi:hypothetical protein